MRYATGDWQVAAHIGDSFAPATALFTGIALLGAIYTLWHQYHDAVERQAQIQNQLKASNEQILQLSLSTQLATVRAIIAEHRKAILELNPTLRAVPSAPLLLHDLRESILRDLSLSLISQPIAAEILARLDELLALQAEIYKIRTKLGIATPPKSIIIAEDHLAPPTTLPPHF